MTLFFDLKKLNQISNGDYLKFLKYLEMHYKGKLYLVKPGLNLTGYSFILNPSPLFNLLKKKEVDPYYIVQYIGLAAKRDYSQYKLYKEKSLLRSFYPDLNISLIKLNPLLTLTKQKITFKFEE
ncbi:MAG TPA: hypothetical protein V6C58_08175 [Allocoleopsis sp.]